VPEPRALLIFVHDRQKNQTHTQKLPTTYRQISRGRVEPRAQNFQGILLGSREPFHIWECFGSEFGEPRFLTITAKTQPEQKQYVRFAPTITPLSNQIIITSSVLPCAIGLASISTCPWECRHRFSRLAWVEWFPPPQQWESRSKSLHWMWMPFLTQLQFNRGPNFGKCLAFGSTPVCKAVRANNCWFNSTVTTHIAASLHHLDADPEICYLEEYTFIDKSFLSSWLSCRKKKLQEDLCIILFLVISFL